MQIRPFLFLLILIFLSACTNSSQQNETPESNPEQLLKFDELADLIMQRMDLQEGERAFLVAQPGRFDPLIDALAEKITSSSAQYLGTISITEEQPEEWTTDFVAAFADMDDEQLKEHLKQVDIGLMMPGATPADIVYYLIQQNLDEGIGRTIHFHWAGAYDFSGAPIDINDEIDAFYQDVLMTTDYQKLAGDQQRFEDAMRGQTIDVTTPEGTDISFEIGERPVTKQDGDASAFKMAKAQNLIDREIELPSGAIRVAPIETTVNGKIAFPDAQWSGTTVNGLVLTFENGKVVDVSAESGAEAVEQEIGQDESSNAFREFALGINPKLAIPSEDPWIPYYGYGAGVVRLSLGDNSELGGEVSGDYVRWNFFTNATVRVGGDVWVQDGKLIK